jgi:hypothetical protein
MSQSHNFRRPFILMALALSMVVPPLVRADGLSPEEQAFFDKHISDVVRFEPTKLNDPSFLKVFSTPFYSVKVTIGPADGGAMTTLVVARIDDKLVSVDRPSTDADLPEFPKMLNPAFKLKTNDDAKMLQQALDVAYPIIGRDDEKAKSFRRSGSRWIFVRGVFFESKLGYVFDVDSSGVVKSVKFMLKLP